MAINRPVYATREQVKRSLEINETARADEQIDRLLESASDSIDGDLHRKFSPRLAVLTFTNWDAWLYNNELISVNSLTVDGSAVSASTYTLTPSDGPPFNRVTAKGSDIPLSPGADVVIDGLFGYTLTLQPIGGLVSGVATSSSTDLVMPDGSLAGVGDLLKIGAEYLIIIGRTWVDSTQNLQAGLSASVSNNGVSVSSGIAFRAGETILIDSEQFWVTGVAGNTLVTRRAWDGTTLAVHSIGADIYVSRGYVVSRGVIGSTAAAHLAAAAVSRWVPPPLIGQRCIAETLTAMQQEQTAYARVIGSGETTSEAKGAGLSDLRSQTMTRYGRTHRHRAV